MGVTCRCPIDPYSIIQRDVEPSEPGSTRKRDQVTVVPLYKRTDLLFTIKSLVKVYRGESKEGGEKFCMRSEQIARVSVF